MCSSVERKEEGVCCVPAAAKSVAARLEVRHVPRHVPFTSRAKRKVLFASGDRGCCCGETEGEARAVARAEPWHLKV